jgi:hypothetical protein
MHPSKPTTYELTDILPAMLRQMSQPNEDLTIEEANATIAKITADWKAGRPIFRDAARFREQTVSLLKIPTVDWFSELIHDPVIHEQLRDSYTGNAVQVQNAFVVWLTQKLRTVSGTSSWFRVSEGLAYKLLATDLKGAVVGDLKLPLPAFYIEIPAGMFWLEDRQTGWHEVRMLGAVLGNITEKTIARARAAGDQTVNDALVGERLVVEAYGEPNRTSVSPFDDTWIFKSYNVENKEIDIHESLERISGPEREHEARLNRGKIGNRIIDGWELRQVMIRFVLNLCIYLGSEKASVEHAHSAEINRLQGGKKFKLLRKHIQAKILALKHDMVFAVGSDVTISPEMKELVANDGTGARTQAYRTLVRGHWRNQAHGPGRALRKRRWIEPHIRGADLPTPVVGHKYDVK